ncbi:helix-turn-helix domain-containing protein [Pleomorphomonas carboxyditropha]|uniref:AraC family transcriptional regulator n=1 Tax=Pleomorphomonas carboxyditropha TaxID=2023338 RepID=A0A2G9WRS7_9HYPH|nr:AraC family transcriptional regulator [Pleomorphomonas carboxyditropha]PIO97427.1 AraC family transcriptional regulator [Pleomorphomonas carboxyditropha]
MPSIPLPFVVSLVLCLILTRMIRHGAGKFGLFPLLVAAFAVQATLAGLSWNVGWHPARLVQPVIAALLPALSFVAFDRLRHHERAKTLWPHLMPAVLVAALVAFWRAPIDVVLFAIDLGYGVALLAMARLGPDMLAAVRFSDERTAHRALVAIAVLLIVSAFVDAAVSVDLFLGDGQRVRLLLTAASVLWLAVAGYAATVADDSRPDADARPLDEGPPAAAPPAVDEDAAVVGRIRELMTERHLYRDPDLTLERLARRAGIPARRISAALNRVHGRNVSQIVNEYRVRDAQRRLTATDDPVTMIVLDSGFGTKSNFNREFRRVTGMTPSAYRRAGGTADGMSVGP